MSGISLKEEVLTELAKYFWIDTWTSTSNLDREPSCIPQYIKEEMSSTNNFVSKMVEGKTKLKAICQKINFRRTIYSH